MKKLWTLASFGWKGGKWKVGDCLKMRGETGKSQFICEVQIFSAE